MTEDQLGTPRMITERSGSLAGVKRHDYLPFGEEIGAGVGGRTTTQGYGQVDNVRQKFTGHERDNETGVDYMQARYYGSTMGRFTSVDPINIRLDRIADPQRLNLYAYVRNNPLVFTDLDGRDLQLGQGDQKRVKKALVEIAKRPGGRECLQKLDKLTITILVSSGTVNGTRDYGSVRGGEVIINKRTGDVRGDPITATSDFKQADKDRDVNKAAKEMGLPEKKYVPASDAQLEGHELAHVEDQVINGNKPTGPDDHEAEDRANDRINGILAEPVDKDLAKTAEKFVNDLLQPNQQNQPKPETPEDKKKKPQ